MNNGYDPSPVGAVGLEPTKEQSTVSDFGAALRDVPVLIQLPDLGGSFETPEPTFTVASGLDDEFDSNDSTSPESDNTDPLSSGEGDWKETKAPKSSWLNRSLTVAFLLGLLVTVLWMYNSGGPNNSPAPTPGLDDWKNGPVVEMPDLENPTLLDSENGVAQDPGNSIHTPVTDPLVGVEGLGNQVSDNQVSGDQGNGTAQPPLPDFTPGNPALAGNDVENDGVGPRLSESGYPITEPSSYRYEEEMPFMRLGLRPETLGPNRQHTTQ
jgi:hypothetical protein